VTGFPTRMSAAQLENLVRDNIERLSDDGELESWLPEVVADVGHVEVGLWRCPSGEITCPEDACGDCGCCGNATLWESPLDWEPLCGHCNRPALLVEVVGRFDYSRS
jgi:hypothetical protein